MLATRKTAKVDDVAAFTDITTRRNAANAANVANAGYAGYKVSLRATDRAKIDTLLTLGTLTRIRTSLPKKAWRLNVSLNLTNWHGNISLHECH